MRKITLPVSNPKKTLSGDLLKKTVQKAREADSLKPFEANDIVYTIPAGAETDNGTNGLTPKLNPTQEQDAALVAKLPSGFPIQEWDSMSTKAQRQAMKFSGLAEPEQWRLLNPSAPLGVLDAANRERYRPVTTTGADEDSEILTNPSKTPYLQNGESDGQLGKGKGIAGGAAPKKKVGRVGTLMSISKYPAIAQLVDIDHITPKQGAVLAKAQIKLAALGIKGEPTQQEIDDILADACTKMLTDENRPKTQDQTSSQAEISAYTNAIDDLLTRLRADGAAQQEELRQISLHSSIDQASVYTSLIYQMIEFKEKNGEHGIMNLRNETKWNALIAAYNPEAMFLEGSQYVFVYDGKLLSVEDLGNAVFGYYGAAMGFPSEVLYIGAGYAAVKEAVENNQGTWLDIFDEYMGDDPEDRAAIDLGISWYLEGK